MMSKYLSFSWFTRLTLVLQFAFSSGCTSLYALQSPLPTKTATQVAETVSATAAQVTFSPNTGPEKSNKLRIWLPQEFSPTADTSAGDLLQNRLSQFEQSHPGLKIEVRIKALRGAGGILDSLAAASAAAPGALPNLIALPRDMLEATALKGLVRPLDGLVKSPDDSDWFGYAQQLARIQNSVYGLPFAGDALVLVYRPEALELPPSDWVSALDTNQPLAFPAADPQALVTLSFYQARGGAVRDDQGRPYLQPEPLYDVLNFYMGAEQKGVMPQWLTQYQNDEQIWEAFSEKQANMVITWTSRYLVNLPEDGRIAPLPTHNSQPFTLATGWVWALVGSPAKTQELSVELAEYLTESSFLSSWALALGYLPPRTSALQNWPDTPWLPVLVSVAASAQLSPPADILTSLGEALSLATVQVLEKHSNPETATQTAIQDLANP